MVCTKYTNGALLFIISFTATKEPATLQSVYFQIMNLSKRMEILETEVRTISKTLRRMEKGDVTASASSVVKKEDDPKYMVCLLEYTYYTIVL